MTLCAVLTVLTSLTVDVIPILGKGHVDSIVEKNKDCLNKMIGDMESFYKQEMIVETENESNTVAV